MNTPTLQRYNLLNQIDFEALIVDLFNARDNVTSYTAHGKSGQKQDGIDIFSSQTLTAIQCKYKRYKDNISKNRKLIKEEIAEEVNSTINAGLKIKHFIYATTFQHDADIQKFCMEYQEKNSLPFALSYFGWEELEKIILQNPSVIKKYFHNLMFPDGSVELTRVGIDSQNCSWIENDELEYAFDYIEEDKETSPIFDFWFHNNGEHPVSLVDIRLKVQSLYSGLSGFPYGVKEIESFTKYHIILDKPRPFYKPNDFKPIQIDGHIPFKIQIQVSNFDENSNMYEVLDTRYLFSFEFIFNKGIVLKAPTLYVNTSHESDKIMIRLLT
ncbi:MAG: hypothetical protein MUC49_21370 [Raineya sp.]|jgi:hypothetical protein|nr:hypothetical protein [Raineya sp.]